MFGGSHEDIFWFSRKTPTSQEFNINILSTGEYSTQNFPISTASALHQLLAQQLQTAQGTEPSFPC